MVSELVKCCSRRMFRFEAVLVVDRRYVIGDVGEDDFISYLLLLLLYLLYYIIFYIILSSL